MRIKLFATLLAASVTTSLATAAPAPAPAPRVTPMAPSGPWNVEFADSMCVLSRPYGKDKATNLIFKPGMIGSDLEIIVADTTASVSGGKYGKAILTVGNTPLGDAYFSAYSTAKARLIRIRFAEDKLKLPAIRGTLSIAAEKELSRLFAVPGIDRALPVLATCLKQLREDYKVSEADLAAITTEPEGKAVGFFSTEDYPSEALSAEQSGTVGVLLWVEATGRVSTCTVIETSGVKSLEQATCDGLTRRGRYKPATNDQGQPIRAPVFTRVNWMLPSE